MVAELTGVIKARDDQIKAHEQEVAKWKDEKELLVKEKDSLMQKVADLWAKCEDLTAQLATCSRPLPPSSTSPASPLSSPSPSSKSRSVSISNPSSPSSSRMTHGDSDGSVPTTEPVPRKKTGVLGFFTLRPKKRESLKIVESSSSSTSPLDEGTIVTTPTTSGSPGQQSPLQPLVPLSPSRKSTSEVMQPRARRSSTDLTTVAAASGGTNFFVPSTPFAEKSEELLSMIGEMEASLATSMEKVKELSTHPLSSDDPQLKQTLDLILGYWKKLSGYNLSQEVLSTYTPPPTRHAEPANTKFSLLITKTDRILWEVRYKLAQIKSNFSAHRASCKEDLEQIKLLSIVINSIQLL